VLPHPPPHPPAFAANEIVVTNLSGAGCRVTVPVGVIATGVNAAPETLAGATIEVLPLAAEAVDPSAAVHGTAVAALRVGQRPDRAPGLIPEARLVVVDVLRRDGGMSGPLQRRGSRRWTCCRPGGSR